jgi:hypothetical protein
MGPGFRRESEGGLALVLVAAVFLAAPVFFTVPVFFAVLGF